MKGVLLVLALVLFVGLGVKAQTMPTMPTEYIATFNVTTTSSTGTTGPFTTVVYEDGANNRTRSDVEYSFGTISETVESLTFINGDEATVYTITTLGSSAPTCTTTTVPISGGSGASPCSEPAYQGQTTIQGQNCDYWQASCTASTGNYQVDYYWNGQTPVEIDTIFSQTSQTSLVYTSFTAETPDAKVFAIPSNCS